MARVLKAIMSLPYPVNMGTVFDSLVSGLELTFDPTEPPNSPAAMTSVDQAAMLQAYKAAFTATTLGLVNVITPPDPTLSITDMSEPTADWYTPKTAVIGDPYLGNDGKWHLTVGTVQWNYTGTDPADTIYGIFLVDTTA